MKLTQAQIDAYIQDGVLVVENVLTSDELETALRGLKESLFQHGVDCDDLENTGQALRQLSSTNGSGGVLDLFYDPWKLAVAMNPTLFEITTELWEAAYCHKGESLEDVNEHFMWHPYGPFDPKRGYAYIDRIGYRIPSALSEKLGSPVTKKKKNATLQRSLTPHLDCSPENLFPNTKWRPIQCFISLTDNLEPNTGGFEAAKGFHRKFHLWKRSPTIVQKKNKDGSIEKFPIPAPSVGEYTHVRPVEDEDVMRLMQHIPVRAGSAVFWDVRIPHANAYRHVGPVPRAVVYCSFLPDISINRVYSTVQLKNWRQGKPPTTGGLWIHLTGNDEGSKQEYEVSDNPCEEGLSHLQKRLLSIDPWRLGTCEKAL